MTQDASHPIDTAVVHTMAALARLEIRPDEAETLARQFASILKQFQGLTALDVTDVEPLASMSGSGSVVRADEPEASLSPDVILANAPERDGDFYVVPKTVGGAE